MSKYIQIHISSKDYDIDFSSMKKKDINYHFYISKDGTTIQLKDVKKKNKHSNDEGIDILLSGKDTFTCDTIFALKHLIHKLRLQGDIPLLMNTDNFQYLQNVFNIF